VAAVATIALSGRARLVTALAAAATVLLAVLVRPGDVFRDTILPWPGMKMVFYAEGATDSVAVAEAQDQRMIVYEDQRGTAATHTYPFNFFFGHLPMLLHPGTPKKVLHICFGVGNSLSAVASHDELVRVDNVELSPHVLEAGYYFWSNDRVLDHPKVHTIIDDGRNHLLTTSETYDVILLEPPEMFTAGVVNLYTEEFYRQALAHLAPDGVVMQWMPVGNASLEDERMMFRAFWDVVPHATTWWQLKSGCGLLVGTRAPLRIDYQKLRRHMTEERRVRQDLELMQVRDVDHLLSWFVFDEAAFAEFVRDVRPTTDDHTVIDFSIPRFAGSGFGSAVHGAGRGGRRELDARGRGANGSTSTSGGRWCRCSSTSAPTRRTRSPSASRGARSCPFPGAGTPKRNGAACAPTDAHRAERSRYAPERRKRGRVSSSSTSSKTTSTSSPIRTSAGGTSTRFETRRTPPASGSSTSATL
jgi:spermidine synthase